MKKFDVIFCEFKNLLSKTKIYMLIYILLIIVFNPINIKAENLKAPRVIVNIESFDKKVITTTTNAYSFKEAIDKVSNENKINIVYSQDGNKTKIYSINDIVSNYFGDDSAWFGFVKRNNNIISKPEFMNTFLKDGDEITVYYGKLNYTQVPTEVIASETNGLITISANSKTMDNLVVDVKPIQNTKIYFTSPNKINKVLITNNLGKAYTKVTKLGVYEYLFKDDNSKKTPNVVRTEKFYYMYGINDENSITRAESVAFLVNQFGIKKEDKKVFFPDIKEDFKFYEEIMISASNGIITGYEDGNFKPDNKINLLQFAFMASKIVEKDYKYEIHDEAKNLPLWARERVSAVLQNNLLENIELNWSKNISSEDLINFLKNFNSK